MPPIVSSHSSSLSSPSIDTLLLVLAVVGFAALAMACITVPLARRRAVARGGRRAVTDLRRTEAMETEEGLLEGEDRDEPAPAPKKWEWHSAWTTRRADAGAGGRHGERRRGPSEDGPTAGPSRVRSRPEDGQKLRVEVNVSQEYYRDKTPKRTRPSLSLVPRALKIRSSLKATPPSSKRRSFLPRLGALSPLMEIPWAEDHRFHLPLAPKIPPPLPPEDRAPPSAVSEQTLTPEHVHLSDAPGANNVPPEDLPSAGASPSIRLVTPSAPPRWESPSVRAKGPRQRSTSASIRSKLGHSPDARDGSSPAPETLELTPLPASESIMETGRPALRAGENAEAGPSGLSATARPSQAPSAGVPPALLPSNRNSAPMTSQISAIEQNAEAGPSGLSATAGSSQVPGSGVPPALLPSNRNSVSTATQTSPIPPPPRHPAAATDSQQVIPSSPPALTMAFLPRPTVARAGTPSSTATTQLSTWPSVGTVIVGLEGSPSTSQAIAAGAIPASLRAATQPELPTLLEGPATPNPSGYPLDHRTTDERAPHTARLPDADTSGLLQSLRVKGLESLTSMETAPSERHRPTAPAVPASLRAASMPPAAVNTPTGRGGARAGSLPSGGGTAAHTLNGRAAAGERNHTIPPSLRPRSSSTMSNAGSDAQDLQDLGVSSSTPRARLHANTVSSPYSVETPRPRLPSAVALTVTEEPECIRLEEQGRLSLEHTAPRSTTHKGRDKAGSRKGKERAAARETHGGDYPDVRARAQPQSLGHQKASRSHDETRPRPRWPSDDDGDAQLLRSASTPTKKTPHPPNTPTRLVKREQSGALRPLPASLVFASRSNPAHRRLASVSAPLQPTPAGDVSPGLASPYAEPARTSSPTLPPLVFPSLSVEMLDMHMEA